MKEESTKTNTKTILITGGLRGIGVATVRRFAEDGWNVVFCDKDDDNARDVCAPYNNRVKFCRADTRRLEDMQALADMAKECFGGLHAVFCNAGINHKNTLLDVSEEELRLAIDTNIIGTVNTLKAAVPLIAQSGGGAIVINASDQSTIGKAASFAYGLTKGALGQMTRSLAIDLASMGIRVNAVCPGTIDTPLVDAIFQRLSSATGKSVEQYRAEEAALFLPGRMGKAEEVAELVLFLASDRAGFCTGGLYPIDGGLTAQ